MTEQEKIDMLNAARLIRDYCKEIEYCGYGCPLADSTVCTALCADEWKIRDEYVHTDRG